MYAQDYDECFMKQMPCFNGTNGWANGAGKWQAVLNPDIKNDQLRVCPTTGTDPSYSLPRNPWSGCCGTKPSLGFFDQPSGAILMGDTADNNPTQGRMMCNFPPGWTTGPDTASCTTLSWVHNEGANLVYVDGHVKWRRP
jgi:prepilin-type processing-associated H-X9-DG protein